MEVNLKKRISLPSWTMAVMLALGMSGFVGQTCSADAVTYNDSSSQIAPGTYGVQDSASGNYLKLDLTPQPGSNPDPGMNRAEDIYQFTAKDFTIGAAGQTTTFAWKTNFGTRGAGDDITITIKDGTNIFDNQGIYMGSRAEGQGGDTTLNIQGGNNIFTQRLIVGGEGKGATGVAGHSTVTLSGGVNVFTYNKNFDWQESVTDGQHTFKVSDYMGGNSKYLGNGYNSASLGAAPEYAYDSINAYNYYDNYYGVFISAMTEKGSAGDGNANTLGADLNITGGANIFNVATYVGGGYDLTSYGSINTSSNDDDVTWGGTNNVNISGGMTNFAARTFFGAAGSTTNVTFSGKSMTTFAGTAISEDMDKALADVTLNVPNARFKNTYRGMDLPYVFFGGKDITEMDLAESGNGNVPLLDSTTTVNINGFNKNMTTVNLQTTAFAGGADERWLAGDQYQYVDGRNFWRFEYGMDYPGVHEDGDNATRKDQGVATFNLNSGKLRLGYVNTTEIVKTRNKDNWNYKETEPYGKVWDVTEMQQRYEQIRLIGAATGSTFNAGDARIMFDVSVHADNAAEIAAAAASGYSGYFVDMPETTLNPNGEEVFTLEAGMIAFDSIHLSADTDITLGGIGKIMSRAGSDALATDTGAGDILSGKHEFYTNAVFVDTTDAKFDTTGTTVLLDQSSSTNTDSTFARTTYDRWFYSVKLEDVDPVYAATDAIETNQVRLHVITKDIDDALVGNMKRNDQTFKDILAGNGTYIDKEGNLFDISSVQNALDQIVNSSNTAEEAAENFDQLIGTAYGNMTSAQIRRISNFNTMLTDQIIASDICLKNLRKGYSSCGGQHCGQCDECGNCRNWTAWGHFYADGGRAQMHNYIDGYETETYGGMFAIDWTNCESCHFGVFFNYAKTNLDSDAPMGYTNMESNDYAVGIYAKWLGLCCTGGYGSLIAQVNFMDLSTERELYLDDSFSSDTNGVLPSIFYERGWVFFPCDKLSLNPFFGLQYVYSHTDGFTEEGADIIGYPSNLALTVSDIDHHSLRTLLGMRISRDWMLGMAQDRRFTTRFKGAWMHDLLGQCDPTFTTSHACSPEYPVWNVQANNSGRDWAILGVGADFDMTQRMSVLFDYNCYVNEYTTIHAGMASLRISF